MASSSSIVYKGIAGIDACRAGWCVAFQIENTIQLKLYPQLIQCIEELGWLDRYLIDIPIGLSEENRLREIDHLAKALLPGKKSASIFISPSRAAVYADHYAAAKTANRALLGKSISIQAWNICPKIREIDQLLQAHHSYSARFYECHPEITFKMLNGGQVVSASKKTEEGRRARRFLLQQSIPQSETIIEDALNHYLRKAVQEDDILDALALLRTAQFASPLGQVVGKHPTDAKGLPMRMVFAPLGLDQTVDEISN
ncbi:MAG: DUF429 domain-containing protein [Bacteroidota bacterium]